MKSVEEQLKSYYSSKSMSLEQLTQLTKKAEQQHKKRSRNRIYAYAAIFIVAIGTLFGLYSIPKQQEQSLIHAFAEEVAFNHQKGSLPEFQTSDITLLNSKMSRLDFKLRIPEDVQRQHKLVGGRYCAIDNRIAAQLKLESLQGEIVTLYVFKKKESFTFHKALRFHTTEVTIWDEDSLIYALASE